MNCLLDTHAVIWFITDDPKLPQSIKSQIELGKNEFFVSMVSFWEISIKVGLGKLTLEVDLSEIFSLVGNYHFSNVTLKQSHILLYSKLPLYHRDPFDRMLIAQGIEENYTIVTKDKEFSQYPVKTLWL